MPVTPRRCFVMRVLASRRSACNLRDAWTHRAFGAGSRGELLAGVAKASALGSSPKWAERVD